MICNGMVAIGFEGVELCWKKARRNRPVEDGVAGNAWNGSCRVAAEISQDGK